MSSDAKIIGFPGDLSVGAGGTLTFTMEAPCDFIGVRFVLDFVDSATGLSNPCMVRSLRHDNREFIANGRTALVQNPFLPPLVTLSGGAGNALATSQSMADFHEQFYTGDLFTITIFNPTANNGLAICYWITDYGSECDKCRK